MAESSAGYGSTMSASTEEMFTTDFEGLAITWDSRVLAPRAWTMEQSRWAAELAQDVPVGPILELCCGAGTDWSSRRMADGQAPGAGRP